MKTLKLPKNRGSLILINIPEEAYNFKIENVQNTEGEETGKKALTYMVKEVWQSCPVLGYSNYEIIGIYSNLSDKTFEDFIEPMYINAQNKKRTKWGYMNYIEQSNKLALCCNTAKKSFDSLMLKQNIDMQQNHLIIQIK